MSVGSLAHSQTSRPVVRFSGWAPGGPGAFGARGGPWAAGPISVPVVQTVAEAKVHEPGAFLCAIVVDDQPVGVLWVQTDEPAPYLVRFMVDASWQGRGIGRRAVALLLDDLRTAGLTELELSYVPAEDGAERFWLSCGFEPTGRVHGGEVVVRMHL